VNARNAEPASDVNIVPKSPIQNVDNVLYAYNDDLIEETDTE
jgi:hypothetical protein